MTTIKTEHSILSGKPFVATDEHMTLPWNGKGREAFCCGMCMHLFEMGETVRWVYVDKAPNTFVCVECDGPDIAQRFSERWITVIKPILRRWGDG